MQVTQTGCCAEMPLVAYDNRLSFRAQWNCTRVRELCVQCGVLSRQRRLTVCNESG